MIDLDRLWTMATVRDRHNERIARTVALTDDELLEILALFAAVGTLDCGHPAAPMEHYRRGSEHWCQPCRCWRSMQHRSTSD